MITSNGLQKYNPYDRNNEIVKAEVTVEAVPSIDQDLYRSLLTMPAHLFNIVENGRKGPDGKPDPKDEGWDVFTSYVNRNRTGRFGSALYFKGLPGHRQVEFKEICNRVDAIQTLIETARAERLLNEFIRCFPFQEERILHPTKLIVEKPKTTAAEVIPVKQKPYSRWYYLLVFFGFKPKPE